MFVNSKKAISSLKRGTCQHVRLVVAKTRRKLLGGCPTHQRYCPDYWRVTRHCEKSLRYCSGTDTNNTLTTEMTHLVRNFFVCPLAFLATRFRRVCIVLLGYLASIGGCMIAPAPLPYKFAFITSSCYGHEARAQFAKLHSHTQKVSTATSYDRTTHWNPDDTPIDAVINAT